MSAPVQAIDARAGANRRRPVQGVTGGVLLAVVAVVTLGAPLIAPYDPLTQDLTSVLRPPSAEHPLGTDQLGRDVLSRVLFGGRTALGVSLVATLVATVIGVGLGVLAAFGGRWWDVTLGRLADVQLAVPGILLALVVLAFAGSGLVPLVVVLALSAWVLTFRIARVHATFVAGQPYIEAARIAGASTAAVVRRHVLPAVAPLVLVAATLTFSTVLLLESSLGFLGLGVQPPTPDWGEMVASGQAQLAGAWWVSIFPGIALVVVIVGVQLVGDRLAERFSVQGRAER
ncbi:ABC transporter permease [Pseudonocardia thermophila]|uniref:ABC transporter permease n=1 Tax=Pseudonocardia thermophila TaxID=1848 RepID=UPI00248EB89B|nr:ABC transporter permease [Pseudonocardia thermophila]